uniref:Uncharacterized protein n=1 Tax=Arundo donax TaxID=35708 RepID=A0A0A9HP79_ARUDO
MATNPGNGNRRHGAAGRQGLESACSASCSMWTNPVARMTPAANALAATNAALSVRSTRRFRPARGRPTPSTPATSIDAMATSFSRSATASSRHSAPSAFSISSAQLAVESDAAISSLPRVKNWPTCQRKPASAMAGESNPARIGRTKISERSLL